MAEDLPDAPTTASPILDDAERLSRRAQIGALEAYMLAQPGEQRASIAEMTHHYFASGVYAREMRIPAGQVVVGKIHKTEHLAILLEGRVRIITEAGSEEIAAPRLMVCPPGTKRVARALTDARWLALHAVGEERDVEKIEQHFIAASFDELDAPDATLALEAN